MKKLIGVCALLFAAVVPASARSYVKPEIQVVVFRADWCGPCKIMEPSLKTALRQLNDPQIQVVTIDTTNGASMQVANVAFDANVVDQYNMWAGLTGFAVIVDPDTKRSLGCVNMTYDAGAMKAHISGLKQIALRDGENFDLTCPGPNR
ncbi:thioredoxin family protein [Robiginitomaculum antarcticum]|uniref:thioredoxin family protein n=1 Tax=Robiginitomaculum antarcticum TaxID=437507 RepID=UPI000378502B|nr:thioredoxin family protein [Robiginitomaculum antarcticum]